MKSTIFPSLALALSSLLPAHAAQQQPAAPEFQPWGLDLGQQQGAPARDVRMSVIGLPLFARQPFVYDYAGKQLRFGAGLEGAEGWQPLAYELT